MATGRSNKLVGQTGEYLVAAELSRQGYIATTFTGNVPHYDVIASDESGKHVSVQVKASRSGSWQFRDVGQFCDITLDHEGQRQLVGRAKACPVRKLVVVFVKIDKYGNDQFYICAWEKLRNIVVKNHQAYLRKHDGKRPKRWDSLHTAISENDLKTCLNKWKKKKKNLR